MKAAFYTLGCKVNQNETNALQRMFAAAGYEIVPPDVFADVYVVNSCTVTAGGDAKSRQWLRRMRRQNPAAVTVLTGCFPQAFPGQAVLPEADVVTGTANRGRLLQAIADFRANGRQVVDIPTLGRDAVFEELELPLGGQMPLVAGKGTLAFGAADDGETDELASEEPTGQADACAEQEADSVGATPLHKRTRAYVKIQDGCNRRCAYCIIPTARGPSRSRGQAAILQELAGLGAQGFAEVVFTGINLSSYGRDTGTSLAEIIAAAGQVPGIRRIRLSSLEPDLLPDDEIQALAAVPRLCPQFHLSLQSGCDRTLREMRRPYDTALYRRVVQKLRDAVPGAAFTTDIIVGFPGEDAAAFEESMAFVREIGFLKVHVFPFSARPGTPAAGFAGQVPRQEKALRAQRMQQVADAVRTAWIAARLGAQCQVLLEARRPDGLFTGYTEQYVPVLVRAPGARQGDVVPGRLGAFDGKHCLCETAE